MQHVRLFTAAESDSSGNAAAVEREIENCMRDHPEWRIESINPTATAESSDYFSALTVVVIFNDEPYATISESIDVLAPPAEAEGIPTIATSLAAITGELSDIASILSNIYKATT